MSAAKLNKENVMKALVNPKNIDMIYDIVCDIFNKKSNFNLDRNLGKKYVIKIIHNDVKNTFSMFASKLMNKKNSSLISVVTTLNKYIVENVVRTFSNDSSYKNFVNSLAVKPGVKLEQSVNPNIIKKNSGKHKLNPVPTMPTDRMVSSGQMDDVVQSLNTQRYGSPKIEPVDFKEPEEEEDINLDYAVDLYKKQRDAPIDESIPLPAPKKINLSIDDLQASLFGSTNSADELPYQPRLSDKITEEERPKTPEYEENFTHPELSEYNHQRPPTILEIVNRAMDDLSIIKEYLEYLNQD